MLDVERGPYVDAGRQQLLDVLPALGMAAAGDVGVRELVDEQKSRLARERLVEVELAQDLVDVDRRLARDDLEAVEQRLRLAPSVRLDEADDDVAPLGLLGARRRQHGVSLADAGRGAQKNLETAALPSCSARAGRQARLAGSSGGGHRSGPRPAELTARQRVEREIELEDIDARLAEQAERPARDVRVHQRAHALFGQCAGLGDARHLQQRRLRRDVRVEPARRGRHRVDREWARRRLARAASRRPPSRGRCSLLVIGPRLEPVDAAAL